MPSVAVRVIRVAVSCVAMQLFFHATTMAQVTKKQVYAAFLLNLSTHVTWPANASSEPLKIGVLNSPEITGELDRVIRLIGTKNKPVKVTGFSTLDSIQSFHILFVPREKSYLLPKLIDKLNGYPTLLITEKEGMISRGSGINFLQMDKRLKIEIGISTLERLGLRISSDLASMGSSFY